MSLAAAIASSSRSSTACCDFAFRTVLKRADCSASGAGELARVLRQMAAASPPGRDKAPAQALRRDLDALLVECDNLAYAPGSGEQAAIDPRLRTRALAVADALLEGAP